ncbi:MAG: VOC family protein [Xanthomonadales bacterium]|nr:VOC family protein [Xanthomonadales bacterium]
MPEALNLPPQSRSRETRRAGWRLLVAIAVLLASNAISAQEPPTLPPLANPASGERTPGKFVWFDLATPNLAEAQAFYQDVFGWSYRSPGPSAEEYVLALNGGQPVAGMFQAEPAGGEQDGASWLALLSVEDVDQAVAAARAAGGSVEVEPASVPARGRHALLRDPAEAIFGVLRSSSGDPVDAEVPLGGIFWVDLFARDVEAMAAFYAQLAPYEVTSREIVEAGEGRLLNAGGMPRAGLVPVDEEANRSAWVPYVRVADVQATLDRAVESGGFVIVAPDAAVLDGNLGVFVDPNGAVIGAVRWEYGEEDSP